MKITKTKSYKAAFTGIAAAVAITLSFLEGLIPTAAFMPPGAKAGFSNIAVMFAASEFGLIPALSVTLLKSLFVFLTRGATAFFMSLAGGVLSTLVMSSYITSALYLLFRFSKNAGYIEIGILSALAHNAGQFSVAAIMVSGESVIGYAPVLLLSALVTGAVTGSILRAVMPKLHNIDKAVKGGR